MNTIKIDGKTYDQAKLSESVKKWIVARQEIMNNRSIPHEIAVITRDKTINYNQNNRVRPVNNYLNSIEF